MLHLNVILPRNRNSTGWLRVELDGRPIAEFRALGRGSRGAGDTSFLKRGNTPTGEYRGSFVDTEAWPQKSYGPWGAVRLKPSRGDAVMAEEIFGRRGLLVHGGALGTSSYWRGAGSLRATWGCLRLSNSDMKQLREVMEAERDDWKSGACREVQIRVTVREF